MRSLASLLLFGSLAFAADVQVFIFLRTDCPAADRAAPELTRIAKEFQGRHVAFYLVYPDPNENKRALENHMAAFGFPGIPMRDPDHTLENRAHATVAPEAAVFDPAGNLKYHGRVEELDAAIASVLAGKPVIHPETRATGCPLRQITFNRDIAPLVYKHRAACHRPGEAAPFSLLTYQDVKKRANQIADLTRRHVMPPWLPEKGYGEFADQQRLTPEEIQLFASWAAAGAPEGEASVTPPSFTEGWQLGPPDLIVEAP